MIVCMCVCVCAPTPHGVAVDFHRSPFILQIYRLIFTQSALFLPVIKKFYIVCLPSHLTGPHGTS